MVRWAEFSRDGTLIATGGWEGTAAVWNFTPEARGSAVIEDLVKRKVPFRYENGALVPVQAVSSAGP
jgi:WD40 repeat protein